MICLNALKFLFIGGVQLKLKIIIASIGFLLLLTLAGCKEHKQTEWVESPTFTKEGQRFYGVEGKIGIVRENGEKNEPDFPAQQGRLYSIYLWGNVQNGQVVKMLMTSQQTGEKVEILETEFWNNPISVKIGFEHGELWKIDVTVDDKPYTQFIIRVKAL